MATQTDCPPVEQLQGLLSGTLNELSAATVERHVLECSQCAERLPSIQAELPVDELHVAMAAKRRCESHFDPDDWQVVEQLVRQTESLAAKSADTVAPAGATQSTSADEVETELRQLLAPAESSDELGRLANYRILRVLGRGGMGIVVEAEDLRLARRVALKILPREFASRPEARQRFLREARAAAAVANEHIVTIHDVGEARGVPYLAMQLLHGESLDGRLKRHGNAPLPLAESLSIAQQIAAGLAAAHDAGLIHRDIKPANVWLERSRHVPRDEPSKLTFEGMKRLREQEASCERLITRSDDGYVGVILLDFGLARAERDDAQLTRSGMIVGTAAFMAPEQARGEAIDARADLFSLGCVMFQMCTGRLPFRAADTVSTLVSVATDAPPVPSDLNAELPSELSNLILRLLEKSPDRRPATAREVLDELRRIETVVGRALLPVLPARAEASRARAPNLRTWWLAALPCLALLAGVIVVQMDRGTIRIETLDDDVQVHVEQNGKLIRTLDKRTNFEFTLRSGTYSLRLDDARTATAKNLRLEQDTITIVRGETAVAKITGATAATSASLDDWIAATSRLTGQAQLDAVMAKLVEQNAGFDGKVAHHKFWDNDPTHAVSDLRIETNAVSNLTALRGLRELTVFLNVGQRPATFDDATDTPPGLLRDLSPLAHLPKLRTVAIGYQPVSDLSPLRGLPLRGLSLDRTLVEDLGPLADCSELKQLTVAVSKLRSLAPLEKLRLETLNIPHTLVSDLSPIRGHPLKQVNIAFAPVQDVSPLAGAPLDFLECNKCQIKDLSPLRGAPLKFLNCDGNDLLTDLTPLRDLPLVELSCKPQLLSGANLDVLRAMKSLMTINGQPAESVLAEK